MMVVGLVDSFLPGEYECDFCESGAVYLEIHIDPRDVMETGDSRRVCPLHFPTKYEWGVQGLGENELRVLGDVERLYEP